MLKKDAHTTVDEASNEDEFDRDLKDANRTGGADQRAYTAYDVKELHAKMPDFNNDELKRIPVLAHGEKLEQGAVYLDLSDLEKGAFTSQGGLDVQDPHLYVAKKACDYELWNKLTGETH